MKKEKIQDLGFGLIIALLLLIAFTACKSKENITKQTYEKDTVFEKITEIKRDTIIEIQADSSIIKAYFECNEENEVILTKLESMRNGKPEIITKYVNEVLRIKAKIPKQELKVTVKDKIIELYEKHWRKGVITKTVEIEKDLNWWQKTRLIIGTISLLIVAVVILFALWNNKEFFIKLIK